MIKIELSPEEAEALMKLIDAAARAHGLAVAGAAAHLAAKIEAAAKAAEKPAGPAVHPASA